MKGFLDYIRLVGFYVLAAWGLVVIWSEFDLFAMKVFFTFCFVCLGIEIWRDNRDVLRPFDDED